MPVNTGSTAAGQPPAADAAAPSGFELYSLPQEALAADDLESRGFEIYSLDRSALVAPEAPKPVEGAIPRLKVGLERSAEQAIGSGLAQDAVTFHDQAESARHRLYRAQNPQFTAVDPQEVAAAQADVDRNTQSYIESVADAIASQQRAMALPQSKARAALSAVGANDEGLVEQLGQLKDAVTQDPLGLLFDLTAENAVQMSATIASVAAMRGAKSGRAGEMAAGFESSRFQEFGSEYVNLRAQGKSHDEAWLQAGTKAGVVALFDAASFGVTGKAVDDMIKTSIMAKVKTGLKATGHDMALGGGGEAISQYAENGMATRVPLSDIFAEAFAELSGAPMQMAAQFPGRAAELAHVDPTVSPEAQSVSPEAADVSGEAAFGSVEPEIVGQVEIPPDAREPSIGDSLDAGAAEEQISPQELLAGFEVAAVPTDSLPTAPADSAAGSPTAPPAEKATQAGETAVQPSPEEGAAGTSQPTSAAEVRGGKKSGKESPRPKANSSTEISGALGGLGKGIGDSFRDALWDSFQSGKTKVSGVTERLLESAKTDLPKTATREQFDRYVNSDGKDKPLTDTQRTHLEKARADIGWHEVGGKLIRDVKTGEASGRTPWVGPDLWKSRPEKGGRVSEVEANAALDKAVAGQPLNAREDRWVRHVLDKAPADYATEIPAEHHLTADDFKEALLDPKEDRQFAELVQMAAKYADTDEVERALEALDDDEAKRRLSAIVERGRASGEAQAKPAADETTPARAQTDRTSEPRPTDLFGADAERQDQLNRENARVARKLGEGRTSPPASRAPVGDMFRAAADKANATAAAAQTDIDAAAHAAATSPHNSLPEPTPAQKEAGNYAKGHVSVQGLDISIENPAGSTRSSKPGAKNPWSVVMPHHYGYIRGTIGADKEHIDVTLGPQPENDARPVFVIDQRGAAGNFDEHKVMLGFKDDAQASQAYRRSFAGDFGRTMANSAGAPVEFTAAEFKRWLAEGDHKKPALEFRKLLNVTTLSVQRSDTRPAVSANRVFKKSDADAAREILRKKLSNISSGIDPETMQAGITLAGYHIERGARTFAAFTEAMLEDLGELVRPYLKSWYFAVKYDPRAQLFAGEMDDAPSVDKEAPRGQFVEGDTLFTLQGPQKQGAPMAQIRLHENEEGHWAAAISYNTSRHGFGEPAPKRFLLGSKEEAREDAAERLMDRMPRTAAEGKDLTDIARIEKWLKPYLPKDETPSAEEAKPEVKGDAAVLAEFGRMLAGEKPLLMRDYRAAYAKTIGMKVEQAVTKRVDELVELAIVTEARRIAAVGKPAEATYDDLVALYRRQPTLGTRTSTSVEQQAYSTPAPLAYVASRLAAVTKDSKVLEPTAGNGMLLIEVKPDNAQVNELNEDRAEALRSQGFRVSQRDAATESIRHAGYPVDVVLANPPFGGTKLFQESWPNGDKWNGTNIDYAISLRALAAMQPNGHAVLIVGGLNKQMETREARSEGYNTSAKRKFYYGLYRNYRVVDHFTVSGQMYEKQGAGWPVDVIVIAGRGQSAKALPAVDVPRVYTDWAALRPLVTRNAATSTDRLGADERPATPADLGGARAPEPEVGSRPVSGVALEPRAAAGEQLPEQAGSGGRAGRADVGRQPAGGSGERALGDGGRFAGVEQPAAGASAARARPAGEPESGAAAGDAGSTAGARRGPEESGEPAPRLGERASLPLSEGPQAPYQPVSKANAIGTLVPSNMQTSLHEALNALEKQVGNLDSYVAKELGYDAQELGKYFAAEQVDALAMAIHQFARGAADIIGDQTGVGKGRVVAGLIRWALRNRLTPIFVTEKPNLYADIYRDLIDINQRDVRPIMTNAAESVPLDDHGNVTLTSPGSKKHNDHLLSIKLTGDLGDRNMVFTTYSQMQTVKEQKTARMEFLEALAPNAVILMDESHNAGGQDAGRSRKKGGDEDEDDQTKVGRAGFARQLAGLAKAVFHSSATWAKRPSVMDLYFRTDMILAVDGNAKRLPGAIQAGGVPLQQAVAAMLTRAGQYIRRERSFAGVEYATPLVDVDRVAAETISSVMMAVRTFDEFKATAVENLKEQMKAMAEAMGEDNATGNVGAQSTNFTSIMHNLIDQMLLALKIEAAAERAIAALKRGEKPVVTVANTMGSFIESYVEDAALKSGDAIALSFKDLMMRYLTRSRDVTIKSPDGTVKRRQLTDGELGPAAVEKFEDARNLIEGAEKLNSIAVSPIDWLHYRLRSAGYKSGEITGRSHTIDYQAHPSPVYRIRGAKETSIAGRRAAITGFNNGALDALIINQAGSTGLSLHASEKFKDQRRRRMVIAQPERNIDTHMQILGRVHRTGQVVAPAYDQLVADIPAEKRPAAVLAKKMASLNANTTAARESQFTSKETLDFLNVYGDEVVAQLMEDMPEIHEMLGKPLKPADEGLEREDAARKVTGRLPLLRVAEQENIYDLITTSYTEALQRAEAMGENALEARTLQLDARTVERKVLFEGKNSDSPFADAAYMDTVDVKRLGKPYTSQKVRELAAESLGESAEKTIEQLERAGLLKMQKVRDTVATESADYRDHMATILKRGGAKPSESEGRLKAFDGAAASWKFKAEQLHIGGQYELFLSSGETIYGVVTDIREKKGVRLPVAGGKWVVHFALADGARHVAVPFSKISIAAPGSVKFFSGMYVTPRSTHGLLGTPVMKLFDEGQTATRERRVMVTGNLLAGFSKVKKGQIVNYVDREGQLRQGIFTPRNFDVEAFADSQPIELTAQQTRKLLRVQPQAQITTMDKRVLVRRVGDDYWISTPKSKADGGQYFLDRDLRDIVGDFSSVSNTMRVVVSPADMERALELIVSKFQQKLITETFKEEAVNVGGQQAAAKSLPVKAGPIAEGSQNLGDAPKHGEKRLPREAAEQHAQRIFQGTAIQAVVLDPLNPPPKWAGHMAYAHEKGVGTRWRAWATKDPVTGQPTVLFADGRIRALAEFEQIALHEAAHLGLEELFGKDFERYAAQVFNSQGLDTFNDVLAKYFRKPGDQTPNNLKRPVFDARNSKHVAIAVNEFMAELAETVAGSSTPARLQRLWDDFLGWIQRTLAARGWRVTFAKQTLREVVRRSVTRALSPTTAAPVAETPVADFGQSVQDTESAQKQFWAWVRKGQPLDRVFRTAFTPFGAASIDERGLWHLNPRFKAAARRAAERLSRTATERFTWLHPVAEKARWALEDTWGFRLKDRVLHGLVDRYGTPADFITRENQKESEVRMGLMEALKLGQQLMASAQSREEAEMIGAALRGEEVTDEQIRTVAGPIIDAIEEMGSQLVEAGVLSREAFERNRRKYHHRSYLRHEHAQGSPLAKWAEGFTDRRRVRLQGDLFKGRGIRFEVAIESLRKALPEEWWGARFEAEKADVRLGGTRWRVLDRTREPTDPAQVEGLPGTSQKKPRVLARVYWPADEPVPPQYSGYADRGTFEVRHVSPTKVTIWRDYNDEERRRMGEILDGRYNAVKTFSMMSKDLATAKFYGDIAKNPNWAQKEEPRNFDGSANWVEAKEITWRRHDSYHDAEFVQVPLSKVPGSQTYRYGQLAGMFIKAPLWRDMAELEYMQLPGTWKALLRQWKLNKTARSPVVHFNNVMSNFILADLIDVRWADLMSGIESYAKEDQHYQDAYRHGVFGADSLDREIRGKVLDPILRELKKEAAGGPGGRMQWISRFTGLIRQFDDKLQRTYQMEDEVFRMAAYVKFIGEGQSPEEAAARARRQFIDYDIRAPWINALRQTVLPFISYTYRAVPLLADAVYNRPWKIAKYMTIAYIANAIGYALTGDDDEDRERRVMDEQYQGLTWLGTPRMIRMPWNDEESNPAFLDIRRWIPAGDVFDMQGTAVDWMPAWMQIGGPLWMAFELGANLDTYKDQPIYDKDIDARGGNPLLHAASAGKLAKHAWQGFMPNAPWLPGSYSYENLEAAVTGEKNAAYQDIPTFETLLGALGPKVRYQNTDYNIERLRRNLSSVDRKISDAKKRAEREFARGSMDADDLKSTLTELAERRRQAAEVFRDKVVGEQPKEQ